MIVFCQLLELPRPLCPDFIMEQSIRLPESVNRFLMVADLVAQSVDDIILKGEAPLKVLESVFNICD